MRLYTEEVIVKGNRHYVPVLSFNFQERTGNDVKGRKIGEAGSPSSLKPALNILTFILNDWNFHLAIEISRTFFAVWKKVPVWSKFFLRAESYRIGHSKSYRVPSYNDS